SENKRARQLVVVTGAALVPLAAFALVWKGSDVERLSLAVPFLAVVLVQGLADLRKTVSPTQSPLGLVLARAVTCLLAAANFWFFVIPALVGHGGTTMGVGREARRHLPPASLLIVAGNDLFADVVAASSYFYSIQVHNITYDVQVNGTSGYEDRVHRLIQ